MGRLSSRLRKVLAVLTIISLTVTPVAAQEEMPEVTVDGAGVEKTFDFVPGHIALPGHENFKMTDEDISFSEVKRRKVQDDEFDVSSYIPREDIPECFPGSNATETKNILMDKYPKLKQQGDFGTCWAFSAIANAEFNRVSRGEADKNIDLSELYLAYGAFTTQENPIVGNDDAVSSIITPNENRRVILDNGSCSRFTAQFLSKKYGYINEEKLRYPLSWNDPDVFDEDGNFNIDYPSLKKDIVFQMGDFYETDMKTENGMKITKEAIMQNGIAGIAFYVANTLNPYLNIDNAAYYYYEPKENEYEDISNHEVAVVGWDDNYPKENFKTQPSDNGAWLVRNSWADESEDFYSFSNYFWLSYEDTSLMGASIYDIETSVNYDNDYYYDTQIHNESIIVVPSTVANVYKTQDKGNEKLTEVGLEIDWAADYEIKVYRNLKDKSNPESGTLVSAATTKGELNLPGVYTIKLNTPVLLQSGSLFSVVVTMGDGSVCFEKKMANYGENGSTTINCGMKKNQSFIMWDSTWKDWYDFCEEDEDLREIDGVGNFCISAHTVNTTENEIEEKFKDPSGKEVTLIYNTDYGTYKTEDGKDVLVLSKENDENLPTPKYQFTGKKVCPSKKAYVVYKGILYTYKSDYSIGFKNNKKRGSSEASIKWKKNSEPYKAGTKKSTMKFEIVERTVTDDMVSFKVKNDKIKNLKVKADGIEMKPKKDDYSFTGSSTEGFTITFKNNYKGTVTKKA